MPFLMEKHEELPEPKPGQKEYDLFKEIYGSYWEKYDGLIFDTEEKITEFNYEKFIPQALLETMDTKSQEFKTMIKKMNLDMKTNYEQHKENQENFK